MHDITDLPAWERLFKKIVWKQLGDMEGKKMVKVQRLFAKTNLKIQVCRNIFLTFPILQAFQPIH